MVQTDEFGFRASVPVKGGAKVDHWGGASGQVPILHLPDGAAAEDSVTDDRRFSLLRSICAGVVALEKGAFAGYSR